MVRNDFKARNQSNEDVSTKDIINNKLNSNVTHDALDQYFSITEKNSRRNSEASTQIVQFKGIDDKDTYSETSEKLPPIPDGGWGWVVVVAAFLISACTDGLAYSFGNLHEEFIRYFGQSQTKTSWIGSLFMAVPLISGPIMSALVEQFGCRAPTMIASIVATGGFLLASISNSVELLCLTLGMVSGLAMGILYVTSVVSVAFWFDKRRTLAVSLASCGIGFGTVIYGPLTDLMLQNYDWRGTLILLSCTILNMCVCGALMREPDWVIIKDRREKVMEKANEFKLKKSSSISSISIKSMGGDSVYTLNEVNDLIKGGYDPEHILSILTSAVAVSEELDAVTKMNAEITHRRNHSTVDLPTFFHKMEQVPPEVMDKILSNKNLHHIIQQHYPYFINCNRNRKRSETKISIDDSFNIDFRDFGLHLSSVKTIRPASEVYKNTNNDENSVQVSVVDNIISDVISHNADRDVHMNVNSKQVKTRVNLNSRHILIYRNPVVHRRALVNMPHHKLRSRSLPDIHKTSSVLMNLKSENKKKWYDPIRKIMHENFNFNLFSEFHFLIFNITSLLMSAWSVVPFFFLKSFMTDVGMGGYATIIIVIGISNGVGIVILGWFGDKPWYNVSKAYAVFLIICGMSVAAYPFVIEDKALLIFVSIVFGVSFASCDAYTPAILMELVPMDDFTVGYGMILLSQGIGNLIGPPLGGLIFDESQSWDLTFYVGGAWLIVSGVCLGSTAFIKNFRIWGKEPLIKDLDESQVGSDNDE